MIYKLDPSKYETVRPLFNVLDEYQPICSAVLEGAHPGKIFVNNLSQPRTAFINTFLHSEDDGLWGFLAGEPSNDVFNNALNKTIQNRDGISKKASIIFLTCHPQEWSG